MKDQSNQSDERTPGSANQNQKNPQATQNTAAGKNPQEKTQTPNPTAQTQQQQTQATYGKTAAGNEEWNKNQETGKKGNQNWDDEQESKRPGTSQDQNKNTGMTGDRTQTPATGKTPNPTGTAGQTPKSGTGNTGSTPAQK